MPSIYDLAAEFRRDLGKRDREATRQLAGYYRIAQDDIRRLLRQLIADMDAEKRAGRKVGVSWLYRAQRYRTIVNQMEAALAAAGVKSSATISNEQRAAVRNGAQAAAQMTSDATIGGGFFQTNTAAAENLIGVLGDGSPLVDVLRSAAKDAAGKSGQILVSGIVRGLNPRTIARQMVKQAGVPLSRAVRIARTETLRAYRQASIDTYQENADVVQKWEWFASRDRNTCAACLAMDGKRFSLDTVFGSHPNCRCTPIPVTEDSSIRIGGAAWFANQGEILQDAVLGKRGGNLYRLGEVRLEDFAAYHNDARWGPVRWQSSVDDAVKKAGRREQRRAA